MPLSFGFLSTYPPTQCGLATFTAALRGHLMSGAARSGVVRVVDRADPVRGHGEVCQLIAGSAAARERAIEALNRFDVAIVQHEYGIYGGPDGVEVLGVLDGLAVPVVAVAHTVLTHPSAHQRRVLERVTERADAVVTMTTAARDRLISRYDVDPTRVHVIPHGAIDMRRSAPVARATSAPPTILTWGLIGPGKGIEAVIDVLPALRGLPRVPHYRVVGQTHPRVLARDGEAYRDSLRERADRLGVADMVSFEGSYLDLAALNRVVAAADVVVLPYESREQVTSGVLIEAVAARKPVVATAFPHAVELLAGGSGLIVAHGDGAALTAALRRVLTEPALVAAMTGDADRIAPDLLWPSVASRYRTLAERLVAAAVTPVA